MSTTPARLRLSLDVSAVPARPAGAGRYTIELATALGQQAGASVVTVSRRGDQARWPVPGTANRPAAPGPRPARLAWEQVGLPRLLRRLGPDVHHGPHYTMPARAPVPVVVTVHDCTFFDHPEWHQRAKVLVFRRAIRRAARRAAALVCVSATTAERLSTICEVAGRIFVAPHGVDLARFGPSEPTSGSDDRALAAVGVDPRWPYVCFVGTLEPRKGVGTLVAAFDRLAATRPELRLVLAGQKGWGDDVDQALVAARQRDRVVLTGYVPDAAVPALLRRAGVVAYPALEEGYGLPAVEALACGAPLVTTAGTAMAELAGAAAVLVEPGRPDDLAEAIASALEPSPAGSARRQLGLELAARRTWSASAEAHLEAYRWAART
jgi:glycosyltransferase involved in cell wall biosynthesis